MALGGACTPRRAWAGGLAATVTREGQRPRAVALTACPPPCRRREGVEAVMGELGSAASLDAVTRLLEELSRLH